MEDRDSAIRDYGTRDQEPPRRFRVTITETLKRTIDVEAGDQHEAEQMASVGWHNSEYILSAEDFVGVNFEAVPVMDGFGSVDDDHRSTFYKTVDATGTSE